MPFPDPTTQIKPSFTCFVIMPFSDTAHEAAGAKKTTSSAEWTNIYHDWIKKAVESYPDANISCERSATAPGNFVKGIVGSLNDSDFAIADLTGSKPNVFYELGIRHALRTGTIIITQDWSALPSDLHTYYCFAYTYSGAHHEYENLYASFEKSIHGLIRAMIVQGFASDSPVSDFLDYKHYQTEQQKKRQLEDARVQMSECWEAAFRCMVHIDVLIEEAGKRSVLQDFDTFEIDIFVTRFYNSKFDFLDDKLIAETRNTLLFFRLHYMVLLKSIRGGTLSPTNITVMIGECTKYFEKLARLRDQFGGQDEAR